MQRRVKHSSRRVSTETIRKDDTYAKIFDTFVDLLQQKGGGVTKDEVLVAARATAWRTMVPWKKLIEWVTEKPNVVILPLTWRNFASERDKAAHSVDPSKYLAPNYTSAMGFADLVPFVEHSERNRSIALTKYSQQQLAAARALEKAERFNAAISGSALPQIGTAA
jgi:hypothetical protein